MDNKFTTTQRVGLIAGPVVAICFCLFTVSGLTPVATRILGLTLWMVIWWVTVPVPLWVTSLLPIAGGVFLNIAGGEATKSGISTYAAYAAPVTIMVIGIFALGAIIEKWNLHKRIALNILNLFKGKPVAVVMEIAAWYLVGTILVFVFNDQIASLIPWFHYISNEGWGIMTMLIAFVIPVDWKKGEFLLDPKTAMNGISWGTYILLGGALTLGGMFSASGIATWIAKQLSFLANWPPLLVIIFLCVVVSFITEAVSNFVVVAAFLPVVTGLSGTLHMNPMFIMMAVSLASSLAFMLPSGTPPNAIVFGTGYLETKDMIKAGLVVKIIGIILFPIVMFLIAKPLSPLF
ncbi:MAG: SLC13 family permease [Eubacterium sp.]